jgi:hypothetical protein
MIGLPRRLRQSLPHIKGYWLGTFFLKKIWSAVQAVQFYVVLLSIIASCPFLLCISLHFSIFCYFSIKFIFCTPYYARTASSSCTSQPLQSVLFVAITISLSPQSQQVVHTSFSTLPDAASPSPKVTSLQQQKFHQLIALGEFGSRHVVKGVLAEVRQLEMCRSKDRDLQRKVAHHLA